MNRGTSSWPKSEPFTAVNLKNVSKIYRLNRKQGGVISRWARSFSKDAATGSNNRDNGRFFALKDISFQVAHGESLGIIGRNGCGKSTLLQILAGLMKPTSGNGTVNGEIAALLDLSTGFHPDFTGRENISLNNTIMNLSPSVARQRMARIETFADIGGFIDEPIRTYSSGMLLRLGFACAIAVDPDVFLVDEALGVGDVFFQQKCYDFMRDHMKDKTRVIVSHDMHAVTTFCSRVIVLSAGEIAFDGPSLNAVEFYMKALHDDQKGKPRAGCRDFSPDQSVSNDTSSGGAVDWRTVPANATGGAGDAQILQYEVRVNNSALANVAKPGDVIGVRMMIDCARQKDSLLFGYLIRNKMGTAVFGENTALLPGGVVAVDAGASEVAFEFLWPEAQPGEYFLTLGQVRGVILYITKFNVGRTICICSTP